MVHVTWEQARAFCQQIDGALPTEAQWEYAARGGSRFPWSFGDDAALLEHYAWFDKNSSDFVYLFIIVYLYCTFVIFSVYTMELSLQQAVKILGKTCRQVLYMIEQGRLPAKKIGGRWVIERTALQVDSAGETNEDPGAYPS